MQASSCKATLALTFGLFFVAVRHFDFLNWAFVHWGMVRAKAKFVYPMLLLHTDRLPAGDQWSYEIKLD